MAEPQDDRSRLRTRLGVALAALLAAAVLALVLWLGSTGGWLDDEATVGVRIAPSAAMWSASQPPRFA